MKKTSTERELAALKKEVARLAKQVAVLGKEVAKRSKAAKASPSKLQVSSLEVVASDGRVVASVDGKGKLFCATAWISSARNVRGVFIDGVTFRSVSAGKIELIGPGTNTPGLVAEGWSGTGEIRLRDTSTKQSLVLKSSGAPVMAYDDTGTSVATLSVNGGYGAKLILNSGNRKSKARAEIGLSHLTSAGSVAVTDAIGKVTGKLP